MNRRGFISSLAGVVAWVKTKASRSPAASDSRPTCVACGSGLHRTPDCPINNAAMSGVRSGMFMEGDDIEIYRGDGTVKGHVKVESINLDNNTIWLSGIIPDVRSGDVIISRRSDGGIVA